VPPCVWYGTAWWLIRKAIGSCLIGCARLVWLYLWDCVVQEGAYCMAISGENLSNCGRGLRVSLYPAWGNLWQSKTCKLELITFVNACSDLLASHQMKCDCAWPAWHHGGSLVIERWWKHYSWVQGANLCKVYNCHDSCAYNYKISGVLTRLVGWWFW
jgi:hypothetical protein